MYNVKMSDFSEGEKGKKKKTKKKTKADFGGNSVKFKAYSDHQKKMKKHLKKESGKKKGYAKKKSSRAYTPMMCGDND